MNSVFSSRKQVKLRNLGRTCIWPFSDRGGGEYCHSLTRHQPQVAASIIMPLIELLP